jgi:Domain of unknown function (DUF4189)
MKKYIRCLLVALVAISVQKVSAQSAVAVGTNGIYGYAYGSGSQRAAVFLALRNCETSGGVNIHVVNSTFAPGFGAIAYWRGPGGGWAIGCALGKRTRYEAIHRSIDECLERGGFSPRIVASWP